MLTLRHVHQLQDRRGLVRLADGRLGKIVKVSTSFPGNRTEVSVYTNLPTGPGIAKVRLEELTSDNDEAPPSSALFVRTPTCDGESA